MQYNYFVPEGYERFAEKCAHLFDTGEPAIFFFAPKSDRAWRIDQLLQEYKNNIQLIKIRLIPEETEDLEDILFLIKKQTSQAIKKACGIFIVNAELLIEEKKFGLIDEIENWQRKNPNYRFILCSEIDITQSEIAKRIDVTGIFSNINYYPIYGVNDTHEFVNYLEQKWKLKINIINKQAICEACGGHTWLLKEAIRCIREQPMIKVDAIFKLESMQMKLEQIFHALTETEQRVLRYLVDGKLITDKNEKHSLHYLEKIGIVIDNTITIPLLHQFIQQDLPKIQIEIFEHRIRLNQVNVDSNFSKKEKKALKMLLDKKNYVVARDDLAKAIWTHESEDDYSDWAIDRIIARLRKKLQVLGLPKDTVQTLRNRGYMLKN